jgi:hypothetical protein
MGKRYFANKAAGHGAHCGEHCGHDHRSAGG